jgi:hypothetical protein
MSQGRTFESETYSGDVRCGSNRIWLKPQADDGTRTRYLQLGNATDRVRLACLSGAELL